MHNFTRIGVDFDGLLSTIHNHNAESRIPDSQLSHAFTSCCPTHDTNNHALNSSNQSLHAR